MGQEALYYLAVCHHHHPGRVAEAVGVQCWRREWKYPERNYRNQKEAGWLLRQEQQHHRQEMAAHLYWLGYRLGVALTLNCSRRLDHWPDSVGLESQPRSLTHSRHHHPAAAAELLSFRKMGWKETMKPLEYVQIRKWKSAP